MKYYREFIRGPRVYWWEWWIVRWFGKYFVIREGDTVTCGYHYRGRTYLTRIYSYEWFTGRLINILKKVYTSAIAEQFESESLLYNMFPKSPQDEEGEGYKYSIRREE